MPMHTLAARAAVLVLLMTACGSTDPRDQATSASCDRFESCGQIGAGKVYETRASCVAQVRANWDDAWPPAECDGKFSSSQLNTCLDAIRATECANGLDAINTLVNKCPKAKVCGGP